MIKNNHLYTVTVIFTVFLCRMSTDVAAQSALVDDWGLGSDTKAVQSEATAYTTPSDGNSGTDYVIKDGDCLWNLAFNFLGNPFQWPQIWENNSYIKNPDLIFPGDILKIPGRNANGYASSGAIASSGSNQALGSTGNSGGTSDFAANVGFTSKTAELLSAASSQKENAALSGGSTDSIMLSIIKSKDRLGGSFFKAVPFLWFKRNASGVLLPGESVVDAPAEMAMYQLYDRIRISIKSNESFKVGDSIDLYNYFRVIEHNKARATVIKCVGSAKIEEIAKNKAIATLYKVYDKVLGGEHLMKAGPLSSHEIDTLVAADVTIQANLITRAEETESPYVFQTLIIDKGAQDGVKVGDVFALYRVIDNVASKEVAVIGYTANVQNNSTSLTIVKMSDNKINAGDKAVLFRRTIFKGGGEN